MHNPGLNRIGSLESLRGLLALWVVIGHAVRYCGYKDADLGVFGVFAKNGLAVDVFIILSGFVIFFLLDKTRDAYLPFIVKRWFRLAPIYLFVLIVSVILIDQNVIFLRDFPFSNQLILNRIAIANDSQHYYWSQIAAHIVMLHGLIADSILPNSQYAFVGQAWSISVEWQFYLVAPLLFAMVVGEEWRKLTVTLTGICLLRAMNYGGEGNAINQAGYFITGIGCYYIWKNIERIRINERLIEALTMLMVCLIYMLINRCGSLMLWMLVFSSVLADKCQSHTPAQKIVSSVLANRFLLWLGKISYSVYMVHMLVIFAFAKLILYVDPSIARGMFMATLVPSVIVGTVCVSVLSYWLIEKPAMDLGSRIYTWLKMSGMTCSLSRKGNC